MCNTSPDSFEVTTGIDLLPFPHTETWDWCPGTDFIYSNVLTLDLLLLEIRQVSMSPGSSWSSWSDSSHQLLEPKHILHSHLSSMPGLPSAGRRCV